MYIRRIKRSLPRKGKVPTCSVCLNEIKNSDDVIVIFGIAHTRFSYYHIHCARVLEESLSKVTKEITEVII